MTDAIEHELVPNGVAVHGPITFRSETLARLPLFASLEPDEVRAAYSFDRLASMRIIFANLTSTPSRTLG